MTKQHPEVEEERRSLGKKGSQKEKKKRGKGMTEEETKKGKTRRGRVRIKKKREWGGKDTERKQS